MAHPSPLCPVHNTNEVLIGCPCNDWDGRSETEPCRHCWHSSHTLTVNPPIHVELCCWCGIERRSSPGDEYALNHGPYKR